MSLKFCQFFSMIYSIHIIGISSTFFLCLCKITANAIRFFFLYFIHNRRHVFKHILNVLTSMLYIFVFYHHYNLEFFFLISCSMVDKNISTEIRYFREKIHQLVAILHDQLLVKALCVPHRLTKV